jgi:Tat protein secretion system quality control protein TatD with DNase activity
LTPTPISKANATTATATKFWRAAKQAGIEAYLAIGNGEGPDTADCGIQLAEKYSGNAEYPEIWASVGVHPHEASLADDASYSNWNSGPGIRK